MEPPPPLSPDHIKINVDAAIAKSHTALATITRDSRGDVLKVWAKTFGKSSPILVEAHAILWGVQLAREEGWNLIILEGNAKSYFDPLTSENISPAWTISNVINNVLCLKHLFSVCRFCWVKSRDDNFYPYPLTCPLPTLFG